MALTDNLISYWKLDEASGNATDSHGTVTLTETGTVGSATGKVGNCRTWNASKSNYLSCTDNASVSMGDIDFTFQAWIYVTSENASGYAPIFGKWQLSGIQYEYLLVARPTTDGKMEWYVTPDGTNISSIKSDDSVTTGAWYLIHAWHDSINNLLGIAINAQTAKTASYSSGVYDGTAPFTLGINPDDANGSYNGYLDEVAIWKRVLTSDERTSLYNSGSGLAYPFTVAAAGGPILRGRAMTPGRIFGGSAIAC